MVRADTAKAVSMRVTTDPDAVARYQAALTEERRLSALPETERDADAHRAAMLATQEAFEAISRGTPRSPPLRESR